MYSRHSLGLALGDWSTRTALGIVLVIGLLALGAFATTGHAKGPCDKPAPPPFCFEDPPQDPPGKPPIGFVDSYGDRTAAQAHWHDTFHPRFDPQTFEEHKQHPHSTVVTGWAMDPDITGPITVEIYSNGLHPRLLSRERADKPRPDVAKAFGRSDDRVGFEITVPLPAHPWSKLLVIAVDEESSVAGIGSTWWLWNNFE